jgi:hypothetical protein
MIKGELIMKKVFMPSMDELYQMQDKGANIYKYIMIKAIESLVCNGLTYPSVGILKNAFNYLKEDPEIARAICTLYPEEMLYSSTARNDMELALRLMKANETRTSGLDYLCMFDPSVLSNLTILREAILLLENELKVNPKYRFEYYGSDLRFFKHGNGRLLDAIFNREISYDEIMFMPNNLREKVIASLTNIEPAYVNNFGISEREKQQYLSSGINNYADRYGVSADVGTEYVGMDILTNPDQNVKRLLRCIKDRNK